MIRATLVFQGSNGSVDILERTNEAYLSVMSIVSNLEETLSVGENHTVPHDTSMMTIRNHSNN